MIINIKHKGLRFAETGNNAGIPQQFTQRLKLILTALSTATNLQDMMDLKALRCHPLKETSRRVFVRGQWKLARSV